MNIDDLKDTWNRENLEATPEISTEQRKSMNLPLEKMRKNMRGEFWSTVGIFVFAFALMAVSPAPFKFNFYVNLLLVSMLFVTVFYFSKFFKLYKEMGNPALNTYDGLKDLLHQLELNKQYYMSFYVAFAPFIVCEMIIVLEFIPRAVPLSNIKIASISIGTLVAGIFALFYLGKWWFQRFYGKNIDIIKNLVNDLK
ncbi:hypothetical protein [Chryseobacterium caseinilyticum]|uniref:DUF3278 domain-containing protein n=1 Tax=Chryseobacterium caseinilyticum TaxID=2771428 RepID=A0ABR8Z9W3_9FLAO|nr:hypothetical protein [Chryseobacterium caseinilyticum]MBD8082011.1 hypothetical protein [Chryseobacterium caseinilyticum]